MVMPVLTWGTSTLADLARVDGKAELIAGRIVTFMPTGYLPSRIAKWILRHLDDFVEGNLEGEVFTDSIGYQIDPFLVSGRQSFSPDVSYYVGPPPSDSMSFIEGAPALAVEVRSANDYGRAAERTMAAKREDYFQAGTLVVWDVDPKAEIVTAYRTSDPTAPNVFQKNDLADAEPAVPGWKLALQDLFAIK